MSGDEVLGLCLSLEDSPPSVWRLVPHRTYLRLVSIAASNFPKNFTGVLVLQAYALMLVGCRLMFVI